MNRTVGILLAGGLSRRFGSPKAFAPIGDELFYERVYRALDAACEAVVIVSRAEFLPLFPAGLDVITDLPEVAGKGPLAGIASAMALRPADRYLVLACDMPCVGEAESRALVRLAPEACDVAAVRTSEEKIPLFSVWNGNRAKELQEAVENGDLGVFDFLGTLNTAWIDSDLLNEDRRVFRNINTITD